jgi:hypothetical protein
MSNTFTLEIKQEKIQLIETTETGVIQVHEITRNVDVNTGQVYGEHHWRTTLVPTDNEAELARIKELLTEKNYAMVMILWDEELIAKTKAMAASASDL